MPSPVGGGAQDRLYNTRRMNAPFTPRRVSGRLLLFCLLLQAALSGAASSTELRVLSSWTPDYIGIPQIVERFARKVEPRAESGLQFIFFGPEAVPAFDQLAAVQIGIFDVLFTLGLFHLDITGVGHALSALEAEPGALRDGGLWQSVDQHYESLGLKLLAIPTWHPGHQLLLREPVGADCTIQGRRIRGGALYQRLLEDLGALGNTLPRSEIKRALALRELDGVARPVAGSSTTDWAPLNRYFLRPGLGSAPHLLLMNLTTWQSLPQNLQQLLLEEGEALEIRTWKRSSRFIGLEEAGLNQQGLQATLLCDASLAALPRLWADNTWAVAGEKDRAAVQALREQARAAGLTH